MPINKSAFTRYNIIDRLIRSTTKPYPTKEELRKACEEKLFGSINGSNISLSTIDKDIYAMKNEPEIEAPIVFCKINKGYCYTDPNYSLSTPLTEDDIEAIKLAFSTLYQFKDSEIFKHLEYAIEKISTRLSISKDLRDKSINDYVQFETVPFFKGSCYLGTILNAIKNKNTITFIYEKFDDNKIETRIIDPYLLKEYSNRWYVIGYNHEKKVILTYGLDRISELKTLNKTYSIKADFSAEKIFKHSFGITSFFDTEPEIVILSFTPLQGKYIKTQPLHSSQIILTDNDKEFVISLKVLITYELIQHILSYGDEVKVIKPASLSKKVKTILNGAIKSYKSK